MPADWSALPQDQAPITINTTSPESLGPFGRAYAAGYASAVWTTQFRVTYIPVIISTPFTVKTMGVFNGSAVSGNFELGVYDDQQNQLVASTSTAQSGTSAWQTLTVTTTTLDPGVYYMACVFDNTTGTVWGLAPSSTLTRTSGILTQILANVTLPSTATWVVSAVGQIPMMMMSSRSFI